MASASAASKFVTPDDGPAGSMRRWSGYDYPDLCDLKYAIHQPSGGRSAEKRLSIALAGSATPPTRPGLYDFDVFCDHNKLARDDNGLTLHLQVTYEAAVFRVSGSRSWQDMLERVNMQLQSKRASGKPFTLPILEIQSIGVKDVMTEVKNDTAEVKNGTAKHDIYTSPHKFKSWIAYSGQLRRRSPDGLDLMDREDKDDEWAACCEFMLHPYGARGPDDRKVLLGAQSAITPTEMLGAYRFLSRVAQGEGGMVVQTVGHPGTLRTQMIITAILRQIVLCKRHLRRHPRRHQSAAGASPDQRAPFGCRSGDPFGIQCVCRPGTMAARLADRVGETSRPFMYILKGQSIARCQEEMRNFFREKLWSPSRHRMLRLVKCMDIRALAVSPPGGAASSDGALLRYILSGNAALVTRKKGESIDRGEFVVLVNADEVAEVLALPGSTTPDEGNWLWQECHPLYISVLDWRPPFIADDDAKRAAMVPIKWADKMKCSLPQEVGIVSITTPGGIEKEDLDIGDLIRAVAPTADEGRRRGQCLKTLRLGAAEAGLRRRYGMVQPSEPDVTIRISLRDTPVTRVESPAVTTVTVDYVILQSPDSNYLSIKTPTPELAARMQQFIDNTLRRAAMHTSRARAFSALTTTEARIANVLELFSFTPETWRETEALFTSGAAEAERPMLPTCVIEESLSVRTLIEAICQHADGIGGILVLVNDETLTISIARYLNNAPQVQATTVVALTPDWISAGEETTTTLEAEIKLLATSGSSKSVVLVAGPEAMDSGWLSLGYVNCCVIFGAPFSPRPVRSAVQAVCGSGEPREIRIIYIQPTEGILDVMMRDFCLEKDVFGLGIDR